MVGWQGHDPSFGGQCRNNVALGEEQIDVGRSFRASA